MLIHLGTNQIYDLNRTGYRIWQLLQDGSDSAAICNTLGQEFDVNPDVAAHELRSLLDRLTTEGLLEEKDADGAGA